MRGNEKRNRDEGDREVEQAVVGETGTVPHHPEKDEQGVVAAEDPEAEAAGARQPFAKPGAHEKRGNGPGADDAGKGRQTAQHIDPDGELRSRLVENDRQRDGSGEEDGGD